MVHVLSDNIKGLEDDFCVVTGPWQHGPDEDSFPSVPGMSLGPDERAKKGWAKGDRANHVLLSEIFKFLGGPNSLPFARSAPILFNFQPNYRLFMSPPQGFSISEASDTLHQWYSWSREWRYGFYLKHHLAWRPPPSTAIGLEQAEGNAPEAISIVDPHIRELLRTEEATVPKERHKKGYKKS